VIDGDATGVPLLIGWNRDEAKAWMAADPAAQEPDGAALRARIASGFEVTRVPLDPDEAIAAYRSARAARGEPVTPRDLWSAIETDRMFRIASLRTAEGHSRHQPLTFTYQFEWESPALDGRLGACHALELPFVFGNLATPGIARFAGAGPEAAALSDAMMDAWSAFARTGDPSTATLGRWPAYEGERRQTMLLRPEPRVVQALGEAERSLWEAVPAGERPTR
jgi:para-nitrobenzyl esterase